MLQRTGDADVKQHVPLECALEFQYSRVIDSIELARRHQVRHEDRDDHDE